MVVPLLKILCQTCIAFDQNKIIYEKKKSGFRPKHSCQTALLQLVDSWLKEMENGNFYWYIIFRFPKGI
jgi:hypothetical protein